MGHFTLQSLHPSTPLVSPVSPVSLIPSYRVLQEQGKEKGMGSEWTVVWGVGGGVAIASAMGVLSTIPVVVRTNTRAVDEEGEVGVRRSVFRLWRFWAACMLFVLGAVVARIPVAPESGIVFVCLTLACVNAAVSGRHIFLWNPLSLCVSQGLCLVGAVGSLWITPGAYVSLYTIQAGVVGGICLVGLGSAIFAFRRCGDSLTPWGRMVWMVVGSLSSLHLVSLMNAFLANDLHLHIGAQVLIIFLLEFGIQILVVGFCWTWLWFDTASSPPLPSNESGTADGLRQAVIIFVAFRIVGVGTEALLFSLPSSPAAGMMVSLGLVASLLSVFLLQPRLNSPNASEVLDGVDDEGWESTERDMDSEESFAEAKVLAVPPLVVPPLVVPPLVEVEAEAEALTEVEAKALTEVEAKASAAAEPQPQQPQPQPQQPQPQPQPQPHHHTLLVRMPGWRSGSMVACAYLVVLIVVYGMVTISAMWMVHRNCPVPPRVPLQWEMHGRTDMIAALGLEGVRYSDIRVLGTHNSYHTRPVQVFPGFAGIGRRMWEFTHLPLIEQLEAGVRAFELDVHVRSGRVSVFHAALWDDTSVCLCFSTCLEHLHSWSLAHPGHMPIFIQLEFKAEWFADIVAAVHGVGWKEFLALERDILHVLGRNRVVTPDDLRGTHDTVSGAVRDAGGWPMMEELANKFIFCLDSDDSRIKNRYAERSSILEGRAMFLMRTHTEGIHPDTAIIKMNSPEGHVSTIQSVSSQGFLVRTRGDTHDVADLLAPDRAIAARDSQAQIVSFDWNPSVKWTTWISSSSIFAPRRTISA